MVGQRNVKQRLKRGELVTVRIDKDKSRLSVVVQSDLFKTPRSVTVIPVTTTITSLPIRVRVPCNLYKFSLRNCFRNSSRKQIRRRVFET
ncbi:MAG: type II toxin-antitoxin system PemK/MazF family toxin [Acetobacter sp.]|nr:type II toxin-antitoxin system PemK/MazF family toxin [Acetobacter sp.]